MHPSLKFEFRPRALASSQLELRSWMWEVLWVVYGCMAYLARSEKRIFLEGFQHRPEAQQPAPPFSLFSDKGLAAHIRNHLDPQPWHMTNGGGTPLA